MPGPAEVSGLDLLTQWWLPCTWSCGVHSLRPTWWRSLVQACFRRCFWPRPTPVEVPGLGLVQQSSLAQVYSPGGPILMPGLTEVSPNCWNFMCKPPYRVYVVLGIKSRILCVREKYPTYLLYLQP